MEWSVFLQDQINSVLSLRTKAEKCLCSGCAVWLLYISIKLFQAKVFVVIEDLYLRNCNWAYLFSGPAAACVFPAKSEQVTPPAYCGLNIWPQSNTLQLQHIQRASLQCDEKTRIFKKKSPRHLRLLPVDAVIIKSLSKAYQRKGDFLSYVWLAAKNPKNISLRAS